MIDNSIAAAIGTIIGTIITITGNIIVAKIQVNNNDPENRTKIILPKGTVLYRPSKLNKRFVTGIIVSFLISIIIIYGLGLSNNRISSIKLTESIGFENTTDRQQWDNSPYSLLSLSNEKHYAGRQSLAITSYDTTTHDDQVIAYWNLKFTNEIIIGKVYWPDQKGVVIQWAQVCVSGGWGCYEFPRELNQWNTFIISYYGRSQSDSSNPAGLYIQAGIKMDGTGSDTYTLFIDSIQVISIEN